MKSDGVVCVSQSTASSAFITLAASFLRNLAKPRELAGTTKKRLRKTEGRESCGTYQLVMSRLKMIIGGKFGEKPPIEAIKTVGSDDAAMRRGRRVEREGFLKEGVIEGRGERQKKLTVGGVLLSKSGGGRGEELERGFSRGSWCERWGRAGTKKEADGCLGTPCYFWC